MLSPYDLETKQFEKSMGGYKKSDVDEFMRLVLQDYEKIYKENATIKNKLSVLVEKIEEYQGMEESIRNAIVSAQKMGESLVKEANSKAELVMRETSIKAERIINTINSQVFEEKRKLEDAKRENALYRAKLIAMYRAQISLLESLSSDISAPNFENELKEPFQKAALSKNVEEKRESEEETKSDLPSSEKSEEGEEEKL